MAIGMAGTEHLRLDLHIDLLALVPADAVQGG